MSEQMVAFYCNLLSDKIVSMFGVSKERAAHAVRNSAIQDIIREDPEYVDHVPLYSWAEDVYEEMLA
jgi:hypothetical protein